MPTSVRKAIPSLAVLALLSASSGCSQKQEAPAEAKKPVESPPTIVTVAPVTPRRVVRTVEAEGNLKGWEEVTVGNKRMGRVLRVYHDMGDRVRAGEPLVDLDPTDLDLAISQAERSLAAQLEQVGLKEIPKTTFDESRVPAVEQTFAALEKAQQNLARERNLRQRGANTQTDYQNAELDERAADAAYKAAKQTARATLATAMVNKVMLDVARQNRADMSIRAPIPTKLATTVAAATPYAVAKRSVAEGQMLKEGEAVVQLVIDNPLKLWATVGERYVNEVKVGQNVQIAVPSFPGQFFQGKVTRVNPLVDASNRTFQVEAVVPNDDRKLHPGGFAKASIIVKQEDSAITVPLLSVVTEHGISKVFIAGDDKKARSIPVELGLGGKDWIEVIGAVPAGAKVVVTGQSKLFDGKTIEIRDPKAEPAAPVKTAGN